MTRIVMTVMAMVMVIAAGSLLAADDAPAGKVLLDQSFEMAAKPEADAPAIGRYALRAVEFADRIEISETLELDHRGRKIAFVSKVVYSVNAAGPPTATRGEATTSVGGTPVMKATFRVDGRKLVTSQTVTATDDGTPLAEPRTRERTTDLPEGPVVLQSAVAVIGPRLLAAPGETKIAWVEFPDDVASGAHVKDGFSLVRSEADDDGVYRMTVRSKNQDLRGIPIGKDGRIRPFRLFGKYDLREAKPGAP